MSEKIIAPWTPDQVDRLNRFQRLGNVHEFTCASNHEGADRTLVATKDGWICPHCDYRQNWAHAAMLDEAPFGQEPLLASADLALLKAAQTGEGAVKVTPDLMQSMQDSLRHRTADIAERYPKLVEDCAYETRLAVTAWVFKHIVDHAKEGGSFRYLIYERLGFEHDAYVPLYQAGGMTISNEFNLQREEVDAETMAKTGSPP